MQRPNFQLIEDQPEKNYMRFVSQYKLDDMVMKEFFHLIICFSHILFILYKLSDGQVETFKL